MAGCELFWPAGPKPDIEEIQFNTVSGMQSGINYQRFDVFNDYESYSSFISLLTGYDAELPDFDEESDTLVSIISYIKPCIFNPEVSNVTKSKFFDGDIKLTIHLENKKIINSQCQEAGFNKYIINFVVINKTEDHMSIDVRNDNY